MTTDVVSEKKGRALQSLLEAAKSEKKDFDDTAAQIKQYSHKADDKKVYLNMGLEADLWFRMTVGKTAQAVDLIGPYLYPADPYRCGHVKKKGFAAPMEQQLSEMRNKLMIEYLNMTPTETDLAGESRRAIKQSLVSGAGVLWTGLNERKGLVQSAYDSEDHLFRDPDAYSESQMNWQMRERTASRWKLLDQFPKAANTILELKADKASKTSLGKQNDQITYYECWMRVGIHRYIQDGLPTTDELGQPVQLTDAPRKFTFAENKLIDENTWETPLFIDDLWPCEVVSYIEDEDCIWPISPLRAALPFQKALNWLFIFYMTKIRYCSRSLFAVMDFGDTEMNGNARDLLESWDDLPFLSVRTTNDQRKLSEIFQQLNLNPGLENFEKVHEIISREYAEHSGLYDILHYGEGNTQSRSAEETKFRRDTSKTRINDWQDRVVKWQSRVARKEALIARYIHTPQQIDVILGKGSGAVWGQIMPPQDAATNPFAVDLQQWYLETDYSIESTSMVRHDLQTKIDALKEQMNTVVPVQLQSVDPNEKAVAYDTIAEYQEVIGSSDDVVTANKNLANLYRSQAQMMLQMQQQQMAMQQAGMQPGMPPPGAPLPGPGSQPAPQQAPPQAAAAAGY